jgi:CheY-like chemotaxis protein
LSHDDVEIKAVSTGSEALQTLSESPFDCCVLDLRLPDMTGFELLETMQSTPLMRDLPVVVFTGKELTNEEEDRLKVVAKSVVLKDVQSPERLFDETALFLHRVVSELPEPKREMIERLHGSNEVLRGRKVLVDDDDIRNIFALTTVLENHKMEVKGTTNGRQAHRQMLFIWSGFAKFCRKEVNWIDYAIPPSGSFRFNTRCISDRFRYRSTVGAVAAGPNAVQQFRREWARTADGSETRGGVAVS